MKITITSIADMQKQKKDSNFIPNSLDAQSKYEYISRHFDKCLDSWTKECSKTYIRHPSLCDEEYHQKQKSKKNEPKKQKTIAIKKVMYNPPATIVFWTDKTKTVVRDETLDNKRTYKISDDGLEIIRIDDNGNDNKVKYTPIKPAKKWKEDGLTAAIVKKLVPQYFDILEKWC